MVVQMVIKGTVKRAYDSNLKEEYGEVTHGPVVIRSESLLQFVDREVEISVTPIIEGGK